MTNENGTSKRPRVQHCNAKTNFVPIDHTFQPEVCPHCAVLLEITGASLESVVQLMDRATPYQGTHRY